MSDTTDDPAVPEPRESTDARYWPQVAGVPFDTGDVQTREVLMTSVMIDATRKDVPDGADHGS